MNSLLQIYHSIPWHSIWLLLGASGIASTVTQLVKKKLSLVSKRVINGVLLALSFAPVAIQYLTTAAAQNPSILGGKALLVAGFASTVFYPFVIKPIDSLLTDAKAQRVGVAAPTSNVNIIEPSTEFQP